MTPIEKAKWLAEFYGAVAAGKTAQEFFQQKWQDIPVAELIGPDMGSGSDPDTFRIKPEPRRMWQTCGHPTHDEKQAAEWKAQGLSVTEWLEVV
jgi:hypothetical protein